MPRFRSALADSREHGQDFADAWGDALRTVKPSSDLRAILNDTRDAWERAYAREPVTDGDRAVVALAAIVEDAERVPIAA